jgi:hypothetical protein
MAGEVEAVGAGALEPLPEPLEFPIAGGDPLQYAIVRSVKGTEHGPPLGGH